MRWPFGRDDGKDTDAAAAKAKASAATATNSSGPSSFTDLPSLKGKMVSWGDSLNKADWEQFKNPRSWVPPALAVAAALGFSAFYRSYLRRIPSTNHINPRFFRRRSLLGKVTSVGDGDNFHLFHTPGGRLAGWGWLRKVPTYRKDLKGRTIPVRIAGVDAPEGAHFGRPAQPYASEALDFLTHYLLGRRVRAYLYRRDQYDRVVARVIVRRFIFFKRDVGIEMLKRGLATCYEAKSGAEFGGREAQYRVAEARAKARKRGLWAGGSELESPREYKTRMTVLEADKTTPSGDKTDTAATVAPTVKATTATPAATLSSTTSKMPTPAPAAAKPASPNSGSTATATAAAKPAQPTPSTSRNPQSTSWGKGPLPGVRR